MATSFKPVKGKAYTFCIGLVDSATTTALKSAPTVAVGNVQVSSDGGATSANIATTPAVNGKVVKLTLTASEMNGDNIVVVVSGSGYCDVLVSFETKEQAIPNFHFVMRDTSGNPATGKTVTVTRIIDGGTFGAGTVGAVTEIANGLYRVNLPLADLNAQDCTSLLATATGCMPTLVTLTGVY